MLLAEDRIISVANYESQPLAMALDLMRIALVPAISAANERLMKMLQAPADGTQRRVARAGRRGREQPVRVHVARAGARDRGAPARAARLARDPERDTGRGPRGSREHDAARGSPARRARRPRTRRRRDRARVAAQAVELRHGASPDAIGAGARRMFDALREHVAFTGPGNTLADDLEPVRRLIADGGLHQQTPAPAIEISLRAKDAGELLTLQHAAYVSEGQVYDNAHIPPLTQTLAELRRRAGRVDRAEGDARHAHRRDGTRAARGRHAAHRPDRRGAGHAGPRDRERADPGARATTTGPRAHLRAVHGRLEPREPAAVRAPRLPRDAHRGLGDRRPPRAPGEAGVETEAPFRVTSDGGSRPIRGGRGCRCRSRQRARDQVAMLAFAGEGAGGDADWDAAAFEPPERVQSDSQTYAVPDTLGIRVSATNEIGRLGSTGRTRSVTSAVLSPVRRLREDAHRRAPARSAVRSRLARPPGDPSRPRSLAALACIPRLTGLSSFCAAVSGHSSDVICAAASQAESRPEPAPRTFGVPPVQRA